MSPIKSMFILYLIISSFELSVCSNIANGEKSEKFKILDIPNDILEKMQNVGIGFGLAYAAEPIMSGINTILTTIGHGIAYFPSAIYSSLMETFGPKIAGIAVVSTFLVVLVGSVYIVYEIRDYYHLKKVAEFKSSENEEKER